MPVLREDFVVKDGLLYANPENLDKPSIHPIHHLVQNAKREWNEKVARQSRTLEAAANEYRTPIRQASTSRFR